MNKNKKYCILCAKNIIKKTLNIYNHLEQMVGQTRIHLKSNAQHTLIRILVCYASSTNKIKTTHDLALLFMSLLLRGSMAQ